MHLLRGFNYRYEFMGWDGLLLLNILHNNQLKELGDTGNNVMYDPLTP